MKKKEQQGKQKCSRNNYNVFVSLSLLAGTSLKSSSQNKSKMLKRIIVTWLLCLQVCLLLARTSLQLESPLIPEAEKLGGGSTTMPTRSLPLQAAHCHVVEQQDEHLVVDGGDSTADGWTSSSLSVAGAPSTASKGTATAPQ
uniref:Uncharacterized protein n=1 Tax=Aegilops tauschii subsp. strangulata TaxID=200361 RepID=A0A453E0D2_AEGTS